MGGINRGRPIDWDNEPDINDKPKDKYGDEMPSKGWFSSAANLSLIELVLLIIALSSMVAIIFKG